MHRITILLILFSLLGRNFKVKSQTLRTPAQILQILQQSTMNYTVDSLLKFEEGRKERILGRKDLNVLLSQQRELPLGGTPKGLTYLSQGDCTKAIKSLFKKSSDYRSLSLENQLDICVCLEKEGKRELSIALLKELNEQYPRHFEISRKLAAAYASSNQMVLAYKHIIDAWILNRNHPIIQKEAQQIANNLGKELMDWKWLPQVEVNAGEEGVRISYRENSNWLAFGLCEALWQFERQEEWQIPNEELDNFRTNECLMNAIITYSSDPDRLTAEPEMEALIRAVNSNMTRAFILFEMRLPQNPEMAIELTHSQLEMIATYLDTCR